MTSQPNPPADTRRFFLATCDGEKTTAQITAEAEMRRDADEFADNLIKLIKSTAAENSRDNWANRKPFTSEMMQKVMKENDEEAAARASPIPVVWPQSD